MIFWNNYIDNLLIMIGVRARNNVNVVPLVDCIPVNCWMLTIREQYLSQSLNNAIMSEGVIDLYTTDCPNRVLAYDVIVARFFLEVKLKKVKK